MAEGRSTGRMIGRVILALMLIAVVRVVAGYVWRSTRPFTSKERSSRTFWLSQASLIISRFMSVSRDSIVYPRYSRDASDGSH